LPPEQDNEIQEQAASLIKAGLQEDAHAIRETLPVFCRAMNERRLNWREQTTGDAVLNDILPRLKTALAGGDAKTAGTILAALGTAELNQENRELYFTLYDSLVELKPEKALDTIHSWEKLHKTKAEQ
jgi:hypothetical protein